MTPRDRWLQRGVAAIVVLHAAAFVLFPADLWGVSQLAAWPRAAGLVWTILALTAVGFAPRWARESIGRRARDRSPRVPRAHGISFPGPRCALVIAVGAGLGFWLLRERTHFFGDGALLVRDRGLSESVTRAVVLVRLATAAVAAGARLGLDAERSLAALSVAAGVVAVFALSRLASTLTPDRGGRWLVAAMLATSGSMALFCGHVEYYAPLAAAVLLYLWAACRALESRGGVWRAWLAAGILPALHLGTLALLPAQIYLSVVAWRRGMRLAVVPAALGALAANVLLVRLAGGSAASLAGTTLAGLRRYVEPYFTAASSKHAFGLFTPSHLLAVVNDWLLVAAIAFAVLPAVWIGRRARADATHRFLAIASLGGLLLGFVFHRELGPYRDWDILAWCGFVYAAAAGSRLVRPHPGGQRVAILLVLAGGLFHLVPWIAIQFSPRAALAHVRIVLQSPSQWSPHARGYMHEELAIHLREHGDEDESMHEYAAAVRANPADARYRVGLGTRLVQRGDLEAAAAAFDTALALRPDYPPAHNNLAYALALLGRDLERARTHADAALAEQPGNPDYLVTRARVLLGLGDVAGARADLETALAHRPDFPTARALLTSLHAREPSPDLPSP